MCDSLAVTPLEMMLYKEARVRLKRSVFSSNRALWSAESHPPERAKRGSLFFCGEDIKQSLSSSFHWWMRKETDAPAVFLRHRIRGNLASPSLLLIAAATRIKRLRSLLTLEMVSCRTENHQFPSPHSSFLSLAAQNKAFHRLLIRFSVFH